MHVASVGIFSDLKKFIIGRFINLIATKHIIQKKKAVVTRYPFTNPISPHRIQIMNPTTSITELANPVLKCKSALPRDIKIELNVVPMD